MPSLIVIDGPAEGAQCPLTLPLVSIGRDDACTFQVLDPLVSRKHLQVRFDETTGKHVIADYRSAHGTLVNGKHILIDTVLRDGDRVKIGNTTLMYLLADHADAPSALAAAKKKGEWKRSTLMDPG